MEYALYDSVYMHKKSELPYIDMIMKIGATPDKSRMIKIHWFSPAIRDLVSPEDVKVAANEVFLASGEGTVWLMLNPLVSIIKLLYLIAFICFH